MKKEVIKKLRWGGRVLLGIYVASGILMIVNGGRLLKAKSDLMF